MENQDLSEFTENNQNTGVKIQLNSQFKNLPNSTAVLVMGILSIVTCWCWGVIGLALGIVSIVLASKDRRLYVDNPSVYSESSYKNLNAGKICAIIGTALSGIYFLFVMIYFAFFGAALGGLLNFIPKDKWF